MSIFHSLILGVIQGLGEFLPISSSGHLLLSRIFLGIGTDTPAMKMLDILLHVGTLLPVFLVFRKEWIDMVLHPVRNRTLLLLIVASVPTLAVYLIAKKLFPQVNGFAVFDNGWFLGVSFLITALFLLICDSIALRNGKAGKRVGIFQAVAMGLFQGIGMIPGVSRSGSTILGGVITGLNKSVAAKFSFMMSAPAILGSLLMEGKEALELGYAASIELIPCVVGVITAALVGYLSIRLMLKIITKVPLSWFALYIAVIGVAYLMLQFTRLLNVPPFEIPAVAAASL